MHPNRGKSKLPWSPPNFRDRQSHSGAVSSPSNGVGSSNDVRQASSMGSEDVAMTAQNSGDEQTVRAPIQPRIERLVDGNQFAQLRVSSVSQKRKANNSMVDTFDSDYGEASSPKRQAVALAELFRPPADLLFIGTFESAKRYAAMHGRWLLVDIQKSDEFNCMKLNRDVYRNDIVRELIQENLILFQYDESTMEGRQFCAFYEVTSFPFVALVDPRTGELAYRVRAFEPSAFLEVLSEFLASRPLHFDESCSQSHDTPQANSIEAHSVRIGNDYACSGKDRSNGTGNGINANDTYADFRNGQQTDERSCMQHDYTNDNSDEATYSKTGFQGNCAASHSAQLASSSQQSVRCFSERSAILGCIEAFSCLSVSTKVANFTDDTASHSSHESTVERSPFSGSNAESTAASDCCAHSAKSRISHLLVRLPDGSRTQIYVHAQRTIDEFLVHVARCALTPDRFRFVTDFPRADLSTAASRSMTFEQHNLVPSGTIYIEEL